MRSEEYLYRAARRWPQRTAVVCADRSVTFGELRRRADCLAMALTRRGTAAGDVVLDLRESSIESVVTDFACAAAGLIRGAVNPRLSDEEVAALIELAKPRLVLVGANHRQRLPRTTAQIVEDDELEEMQSSPSPSPEDSAALPAVVDRQRELGGAAGMALRFTGGTTGTPKAVLRTHEQHQWIAMNLLSELCDLRESDVFMHTQPMTLGTQAFVLPCVMRGVTQVILPRFSPEAALGAIVDHGVTVLKCVPTALHRIVRSLDTELFDVTSVRQIIYGAAPMPESVLQAAFKRFGPILSQCYGQTEAPITITRLTVEDHAAAAAGRTALLRSAGRPYTTVDVRIVDETGDVAVGELGEVAVRGPMVPDGYWSTGKASPIGEDGYVRTGDIGYLDADGYLFLVDRRGDKIVSGGYNVFPGEIERVLSSHPLVESAVAMGVPDAEWGQRVAAGVVPTNASHFDGGLVEELTRFCRSHLATYKIPQITIVDHIPLTAAGKPDRRAAVSQWQEAQQHAHR